MPRQIVLVVKVAMQCAYIAACKAGTMLEIKAVAESVLSLVIKLDRYSGSILLIKSSRKPAGRLESELVRPSKSCKGP